MSAFYRREEDSYVATVHTRGPWDEGAQHGGPPSALLLRAMREAVEAEAGEGFSVTRLTTEFLKPVPIARLRVAVQQLRAGRTAVRVSATLCADREVMTAAAVFLRRDESVKARAARREGLTGDQWPAPDEVERFIFPFFAHEEGYHRAIELKLVDPPWGTTPVRFWARPVVDLVEDEATAPEESVVILADAESGMGPPVDPFAYTYLNPDLSVHFARRPAGAWVGLDIASHVGDAGAGLSEAQLRDERGVFGRSAQSVLIAPR